MCWIIAKAVIFGLAKLTSPFAFIVIPLRTVIVLPSIVILSTSKFTNVPTVVGRDAVTPAPNVVPLKTGVPLILYSLPVVTFNIFRC